MTYIDAPVSGTKAPAEKAQITVLASGDRKGRRCRTGVCGYLPRDAVVWRGGQQPENEAGPQCWLISMMQGIAESAQLAKTLGFTPTSCGAPRKAARWRRPMSK